ncbi:MAG: class II glutamine amidotransferase [Thermoprotei archaeon]
MPEEGGGKRPLNPKDPVHGDGWGFALVNEKGIEYYRTHRAIFRDTLTPQFEGYFLMIVHARQTSFEDLVSSKHSHPYHYLTPLGEYFFAHNGSVDREGLARLLGVSDPKRYVDSELAGMIIAQRGIEEGYKLVKKYMRTSLDSLVIHLDLEKRARLYYYGDFDAERVKSKGLPLDYYQLYKVEGDGYEAVVSSSLLRDTECSGLKRVQVTNGVISMLGKEVSVQPEN